MMTRPETYANPDVLEFYKHLPFNYSSEISLSAAALLSNKQDILNTITEVLEVFKECGIKRI
jgi:hypothetical protein